MKEIKTRAFEKLAKGGPNLQENLPWKRDYSKGLLETLEGTEDSPLELEELWGIRRKPRKKKPYRSDPLDRQIKVRYDEPEPPKHPL